MPRRETKRFKTGSFVISFGDLMLPLVCLVALGLLLVAGKMFFLSGFRENRQPIPVTAEPKRETPPAKIEGASSEALPARQPGLFARSVSTDRTQGSSSTGTNIPNRNRSPQSDETARQEKVIVIVPPLPAPQTQSKPGPKPVAPKPAASRPAHIRPRQAQPNKAAWKVQVGAYSTKGSADSVVKTLAQSGHSAAVFSGQTLYRVLVQAGTTKQEASNLAVRLERNGFPGAFIVPPIP